MFYVFNTMYREVALLQKQKNTGTYAEFTKFY